MIRIANAPCSWGVLEFESAANSASFDRVLDEIRDTGYAGTELGDWGFMPTDPARLAQEVASRDLQLIAAFVPARQTHVPRKSIVSVSRCPISHSVRIRAARPGCRQATAATI